MPRLPNALVVAGGWLGAAVLVACAVTFGGLPDYPSWYALAPTLATVAIIASGELARSPGRAMQVPPLRFSGRISYSLYLWHWPVFVLAAAALGATLELPVALLLAGGAILAATASYRFIEQPFRHPKPGGTMFATLRQAGVAIAAVSILAVGVGAFVTTASGLGASSQAAGTSPAGAGSAADVASLDDPVVVADGQGSASATGGPPIAPGGVSPVSALSPDRRAASPGATGLGGAAASPGADLLPGASAGPTPVTSPGASPGPSDSPAPTPIPSPTPSFVAAIAARPTGVAATGALPADVQPGIAAARADSGPLFHDGCAADRVELAPKVCAYGRADAPHTVVLIGDSHAAEWFGALRVLAKERDWRLIPLTKNACTFIDARIIDPISKREYVECATWIDAVIRLVPTLHPDLVVVGMNRWIVPGPGAPVGLVEQGRAVGTLLAELPHPVVLLSDTPFFGVDVPACLAANRGSIDACRAQPGAVEGYYVPREKAAASSGHATLVDMTRAICPSLPCSAVVDDTIVMRDEHHMTYTFSRHMAGPLGAVLDRIGLGLLPEANAPGQDPLAPGRGSRGAR